MKVATMLSERPERWAARARKLGGLGFDGAFTFEGPHDPFLPLGVASQVSDLEVYTNVAIAFPRSPTQIAHQAYDLQALSGGRFMLGLGSQIRPHIERRYGSAWSKPVERMREMVAAVKAIFGCWYEGERLRFEGDFYRITLMPPTFDPGPSPHGPPPILLGALGPRMTRMAAEVADGLLVHPFNSKRFLSDEWTRDVARGREASGRERDDVRIVGNAIVCTGATEDERRRAEDGARGLLAFYGSTPAYRRVLEAEGYDELQTTLNALSKEGRWGEMPGLVDDALLDAIAIRGTPDSIADGVIDRYGGVVDRIGLSMPYEASDETVSEVLAGFRRAERGPAG